MQLNPEAEMCDRCEKVHENVSQLHLCSTFTVFYVFLASCISSTVLFVVLPVFAELIPGENITA